MAQATTAVLKPIFLASRKTVPCWLQRMNVPEPRGRIISSAGPSAWMSSSAIPVVSAGMDQSVNMLGRMASVAEKPVARRRAISGNWIREGLSEKVRSWRSTACAPPVDLRQLDSRGSLGEGQVLVPLIEDHPDHSRRAGRFGGEVWGHGPIAGWPIVEGRDLVNGLSEGEDQERRA